MTATGWGVFWRDGRTEPDDVHARILEHSAWSVCCGCCHSCACRRLQIIHIPGKGNFRSSVYLKGHLQSIYRYSVSLSVAPCQCSHTSLLMWPFTLVPVFGSVRQDAGQAHEVVMMHTSVHLHNACNRVVCQQLLPHQHSKALESWPGQNQSRSAPLWVSGFAWRPQAAGRPKHPNAAADARQLFPWQVVISAKGSWGISHLLPPAIAIVVRWAQAVRLLLLAGGDCC